MALPRLVLYRFSDYMKEIRVAVCGIEGYGKVYLPPLLTEGGKNGARLTAAIDLNTRPSPVKDLLREHGVPTYASLEEFYAKDTCDLVVLSLPIQLHCPQTLLALAHGSHVLCEKPVSATLDEAHAMQEAEKRSGKTVSIGYQWSYSTAMQRLKDDIRGGLYGRTVRLRTLALWPRSLDYYRRNDWAGRLQDEEGRWVLDSPANNAAAHFLFNMLYVLGHQPASAASPMSVEARRWRAFPITNYDTIALRVTTTHDAPLYFYSSHACREDRGPDFSYEFEKGTVSYESIQGNMVGLLETGRRIDYGSPEDQPFAKLWFAVNSARTGAAPLCGISAAMTHTACVALIQDGVEPIRTVPQSRIQVDQGCYSIEGIEKELTSHYKQGTLPPGSLLD